jgi:hypothetical protein
MTKAEYLKLRGPLSGVGVVAVTPSDTVAIVAGGVALAFRVGTGGTVAFICPDGSTGSITAADKEFVDIPVTHIKSTGTAALNILAIV